MMIKVKGEYMEETPRAVTVEIEKGRNIKAGMDQIRNKTIIIIIKTMKLH